MRTVDALQLATALALRDGIGGLGAMPNLRLFGIDRHLRQHAETLSIPQPPDRRLEARRRVPERRHEARAQFDRRMNDRRAA